MFPRLTHTILVAALLASLGVSGIAFAAGREGARPLDRPRPSPEMIEERRAKIMEKIETIRIAKLTDALDLDPAAAKKLFPALEPFSERRKAAMRTRLETMRGLKKQFDGEPDAKEVSALLDRMSANQKEFSDVQQEEYQSLKKVLEPIALAKYYRFQIEFERNVGQLIRQARGGRERRNPEDAEIPGDR